MLNPINLIRRSSKPARHKKEKLPTTVVFSNRDMRRLKKTVKHIDKMNSQLDRSAA